MATDFTKLPLDILVDLINFTDGCALSSSDITFSPPTALVSGNRNTGVTVTATPSSPYSGSRDLTYNRVDLASVPGERSTTFSFNGAVTMSDLIPQINAAYLINLQPEDYYNDLLPNLSDPSLSSFNFALRAKPGSYIWRNQLILTGQGNLVIIGNVITQNLLNGFILPEVAAQLQSNQTLNGVSFAGSAS